MIPLNNIKVGNWISLPLPGSLIEAYTVIEKSDYSISIEAGTEYTLIFRDKRWQNIEVPRKISLPGYGIKGVPLTVEIIKSCGFQQHYKETMLTSQTVKSPAVRNCYSFNGFIIIDNAQQGKGKFTVESGTVNIDFVHELQNSYGDCMNKELQIKLPRYNYNLLHRSL